MKKDISGRISIGIAFGALALSLISLCRDCSQDREFAESNYILNATLNAPILEVIDPLETLEWHFSPTDLKKSDLDSTLDIYVECRIKGWLRFKNTGNVTARIIAYCDVDSFTADDYLRENLLDENKRNANIHPRKWASKEFFAAREVFPSDTIFIEVDEKINRFQQDSLTVLHIIILYTNDMGALYDTYYFLRLHNRKPIVKANWQEVNNGFVSVIKFANCDLLAPIDDHKSTKVYTKRERDDITNWFRKKMIDK